MKPLGLQLYSVREYTKQDFIGTLKKVASFGYAGVEFAGLGGHNAADIRKVLDDLGLKAASAHQGNVTPEAIDDAKVLGYDTFVIPHRGRDKFADMQGIDGIAAELNGFIDQLKPHGIRLAYHNHDHEMAMVDGKHAFEWLLEKCPGLWAQIDTYWARNFGAVDAAAFVTKWAARAASLHIKDGPLVKGEPMTAVGKGKMDVPAIVRAADKVANIQWLIVELDACATDMMEAVRQSAEYMIGEGLAAGRK